MAALGHHVVIETSAAAAAEAVATVFAAMIAPVGPEALKRLTVDRKGDRWTVSGATSTSLFEGSLDDACWYLRYEVTRLLMAARTDLVWLHAAGVVRGGRALVIAGTSGSGKSTLAARLVGRGFQYLGDEVMPFDPGTGRVHPFPMAPAVRAVSPRGLPDAAARALVKSTVQLDAGQIARGPSPVGAFVFPMRSGGVTGATPLSPSHAAIELLGHCLDDAADRARAVRAAAALAGSGPAIRMTFDDIDAAVSCAERYHDAAPLTRG